jgi:hypothetical protein
MTFSDSKICFGLALSLCSGFSQVLLGDDDAIKLKAAENAMIGYDHGNHFKKKLLDFVAPVYNQPTVQAGLIANLSAMKKDAGKELSAAVDTAAMANASLLTSTVQVEQQGRLMEHSLKLQMLEQQGIKVGGVQSAIRAGGITGKIMELELSTELIKAKVAAKAEAMEASYQLRQIKLANRIRLIKSEEIRSVTAKSGNFHNVLISSMKSSLLNYGYTIGNDPRYSQEFASLLLPFDDFKRIRLQLDDEGEAVSFPATKGSSDLGKLPTVLNNPSLLPVVRDIEGQLDKLSKMEAGADFYNATVKLSDTLRSFEKACDDTIGTSRECAAKGMQVFRVWQSAKDYRERLRGLLNRLELEGSSEILKFPRGKYDPTIHGDGILPFAKFIADNGCKVAPAAPGDEASYVRLLQLLRQLEAILNQ